MKSSPRALTIAGSDSGGGAGIQADLKTFAAHGVYGTSAITAITAQNTSTVSEILEIPDSLVGAQIDAVMSDIGADVIKTGMLANSKIVEIVSHKLTEFNNPITVVDPVMVAKSGDRLLNDDAIHAVRKILIPNSTLITPNIPEAETLVQMSISTLDDMHKAVIELYKLGAKSVLLKGGHLAGAPTDIFYDGEQMRAATTQRIDTNRTHGTGCTYSAAIAANLAKGLSIRESISAARRYITDSIKFADTSIGLGNGPVNHFHHINNFIEKGC